LQNPFQKHPGCINCSCIWPAQHTLSKNQLNAITGLFHPSKTNDLYLYIKKNTMLTNNDILKKLRVALSLKNDDIIDILKLADFEISKGALGDLFRNEDHPGYVEAQDQVLRNFLNGLIIYKRGKLPNPKQNVDRE